MDVTIIINAADYDGAEKYGLSRETAMANKIKRLREELLKVSGLHLTVKIINF